jgi:hypothetical protein
LWRGWHDEPVELTGAALAERYNREAVRPLLDEHLPGLPHAAGRLGTGSDVLGLDDAISRDHDWGLRLTLLLDDAAAVADVDGLLDGALPERLLGLPTRFATTMDARVRHRVEVSTVEAFAAARLGVDASRPLDVLDWLTLTGQSVLEVTAGPVFADTSGRLTAVRARLGWYPDDVWRYVVAADWSRLAQELPLVGRTAGRGDEIGSRILAARLATTAMHLGFLLERRWPPYPKWLGTAFAALPQAAAAGPALMAALTASAWPDREAGLCSALEVLHDVQVAAGLPTVERIVVPFHDRGFCTVGDSIVDTVMADVTDPEVLALPRGVGSLEQWVDNVDVLTRPDRRAAAVGAWQTASAADR